jgi:hypothetical protein
MASRINGMTNSLWRKLVEKLTGRTIHHSENQIWSAEIVSVVTI